MAELPSIGLFARAARRTGSSGTMQHGIRAIGVADALQSSEVHHSMRFLGPTCASHSHTGLHRGGTQCMHASATALQAACLLPSLAWSQKNRSHDQRAR